jgi:hypothetical protein
MIPNSISKMVKDILYIDDVIDAGSIVDVKGNNLSSAPKESYTKDIKNMARNWR